MQFNNLAAALLFKDNLSTFFDVHVLILHLANFPSS